jgi:hypothetical protein
MSSPAREMNKKGYHTTTDTIKGKFSNNEAQIISEFSRKEDTFTCQDHKQISLKRLENVTAISLLLDPSSPTG